MKTNLQQLLTSDQSENTRYIENYCNKGCQDFLDYIDSDDVTASDFASQEIKSRRRIRRKNNIASKKKLEERAETACKNFRKRENDANHMYINDGKHLPDYKLYRTYKLLKECNKMKLFETNSYLEDNWEFLSFLY